MTKSKITITVFLITCTSSLCLGIASEPYLGQKPPGIIPEVFAPDIISVQGRYEDGITFTPDGLECCIAVTDSGWTTCNILYTQYADGQWSTPQRAYFQGSGDGWTSQFAPDGLGFYFISTRTGYQPDVWMCSRSSTSDRWSAPSLIPAPVSPTNQREWAPAVTIDRTLYWTSPRPGGFGANDIWRSHYINGAYPSVENIGPPVNTDAGEQSAFIAPDESYLIFSCGGRPDTLGSTDLYLSFRDTEDTWSIPVNLGPTVNSGDEERAPYVSFDGKYLFFTRRDNSGADVYWVDARIIFPDPNGSIQNLTSGQRFSSIQSAINYAANSDEILLPPGIYKERINLTGKNLILKSIDPNDPFYVGGTIIDGDPEKPVLTLSDNSSACEIAGLTIRAGSVGITGNATNATIHNCRIIDNVTHGMELFQSSSPLLKSCLITANGQTGIKMHPPVGRGKPPCTPVIENCVIVDNGDAAINGGESEIIDSIIQD